MPTEDKDYEEAVQKWRKHYGQADKPEEPLNASLVSSINGVDTAMSVSVFNGFPSTPFHIKVGAEEMQVTWASGHTWEVARGVNGTTAANHLVGDWINLVE